MDEDGIEIDRAILRALLKGLKKACSVKTAGYWPNFIYLFFLRINGPKQIKGDHL